MARLKQIGIDVDVHRAIEAQRLSFAEAENDILRRILLTPRERSSPAPKTRISETRQRGDWAIRLGNETYDAANLKDAYCGLLRRLAAKYPAFITDFARQSSRSRAFVARVPDQLYKNSPHLAKDHAQKLIDGWFVDTNLSESQVSQRVRAAAVTANLVYGKDVSIAESGRTI